MQESKENNHEINLLKSQNGKFIILLRKKVLEKKSSFIVINLLRNTCV